MLLTIVIIMRISHDNNGSKEKGKEVQLIWENLKKAIFPCAE